MIKDILRILFYDPETGWTEDTIDSPRQEMARMINDALEKEDERGVLVNG